MTQKQLEREISRTYYKARKNIGQETYEYLKKFQAKDEIKRQLVADGKLSPEEYSEWLDGQKTYMNRNEYLVKAVNQEYANADRTAEAYINGELPTAYIDGYYTYGKRIYDDVGGISYSLVDKNAVRRLVMEKGDLPIATYTAGTAKHTAYVDKKARQAITQGIIRGDSVESVAKNINKALNVVTEKERKATIRNARTLMNGAHNAGGYDAMEEASKDGIILDKQWIATHDERTRDSHAHIDGQVQKWDKKFSNGLRYPQDSQGAPAEVYNCRCTMREITRGFFNKYTGKTEMLGDAPQDEYTKKAKAYWEQVNAEKEAVRAAKAKLTPEATDYTAEARELRERLLQQGYATTDDLIELGGKTEQAYLQNYEKYRAQEEETVKRYNELTKQYDKINGDINEIIQSDEYLDLRDKHIYKVSTKAEEERYEQLSNELKALRKQRQDTLDEELSYKKKTRQLYGRRDAYKETVSEIRGEGFGRGNLTEKQMRAHLNNSRSSVRDAVLEGYEQYPTSWVERSVQRSGLTPRKADRGYYSDMYKEIAISGRGYDCAVHELGHRMEYTIPKLKDSEKAFYSYRTDGEPLQWLGQGYRKDEVTRFDHFSDAYMGKDYGGRAYELSSMGYESIMGDTAKHEAFRTADEEMFQWLTGMMCLY